MKMREMIMNGNDSPQVTINIQFGIGCIKYEKSLHMNQLKCRHRFHKVSIVLVVFICT
jgi:uncharacterized protein involved in high-affinity Fe2+ transport